MSSASDHSLIRILKIWGGLSLLFLLVAFGTMRVDAGPGLAPQADLCKSVSEIPVEECQDLVALYDDTNGDSWTINTGWKQTTTPCSWYGVSCAFGHVYTLSLSNNNLDGTLPALANLSSLSELHLSDNLLTGVIPDFTNSGLHILDLHNNQLDGSIPKFLSLTQLRNLDLGSNQLTGTIPYFSALSNLQTLDLSYNQLSGSVPNFDMPDLTYLRLSSNTLTDSLPDFNALSNLQYLYLSYNHLSGGIPDFDMPDLQELYLSWNQFSGSIPEFTGLPSLQRLYLDANQLSGPVPSSLGDLTHLDDLVLDLNDLTGPLPMNLTNLSLDDFYFHNTQVCEPPDATFQTWLDGIPNKSVTNILCYTDLQIQLSGEDVTLSLLHHSGGDTISYAYYRNSAPYFDETDPGVTHLGNVSAPAADDTVSYTDTAAAAAPPHAYYYQVAAKDDGDVSYYAAGEVGLFQFALEH